MDRTIDTACGHAYVNSDGHCLHCGQDLSVEIAAAGAALNTCITAGQGGMG